MKPRFGHAPSVIHALVLGGLMLAVAPPAVAAGNKRAPEPAERGGAEMPVVRNPVIQVQDDYIRLGDLFDPVARYAGRAVARAPALGGELVLPATWLWKTAKTFGVDWRPVSAADTITVTRPSSVVGPDQIKALLRDAYFRRTGEDELIEMEAIGGRLRIDLPVTVAPSARIDRFDLDARSGRFTATLIAPASGRALERIHVSGRFHRLVEVPVPVSRLGRGHIIGKEDIVLRRLREESLGTNLIVDPERLIGQAVKRSLKSAEPVRLGDVRAPVMVEKNRVVTVTLRTDAMVLTVQGRALETGAIDDVIRVQNTQSTAVIDTVVTGPGRVEVRLADAAAAPPRQARREPGEER